MCDCTINTVDHFGGDDHVQKLVSKVIGLGSDCAFSFSELTSCPHLDTRAQQVACQNISVLVKKRLINQQAFSRTADPGATRFGIQQHGARFFQISARINVDVANPFKVGENRHASLALHQSDKPFTTTRYNHVNVIRCLNHSRNGSAVACWDQLN